MNEKLQIYDTMWPFNLIDFKAILKSNNSYKQEKNNKYKYKQFNIQWDSYFLYRILSISKEFEHWLLIVIHIIYVLSICLI